jgi:hypothetical protein
MSSRNVDRDTIDLQRGKTLLHRRGGGSDSDSKHDSKYDSKNNDSSEIRPARSPSEAALKARAAFEEILSRRPRVKRFKAYNFLAVGKKGAGKSTTLNMIYRTENPKAKGDPFPSAAAGAESCTTDYYGRQITQCNFFDTAGLHSLDPLDRGIMTRLLSGRQPLGMMSWDPLSFWNFKWTVKYFVLLVFFHIFVCCLGRFGLNWVSTFYNLELHPMWDWIPVLLAVVSIAVSLYWYCTETAHDIHAVLFVTKFEDNAGERTRLETLVRDLKSHFLIPVVVVVTHAWGKTDKEIEDFKTKTSAANTTVIMDIDPKHLKNQKFDIETMNEKDQVALIDKLTALISQLQVAADRHYARCTNALSKDSD